MRGFLYYQEGNLLEKMMIKLSFCQGIGVAGKWKIIKACKLKKRTDFTLSELVKIAEISQKKESFKVSWQSLDEESLEKKMADQKFISFFSNSYPKQLKQIYDPPLILFYEGNIDLLQYRILAFVGARRCTVYGQQVCNHLIPAISAAGFVVVSGLAKGVDRFAHQAAIQANNYTIAVVATGVNVCYPKENAQLQQHMQKHHLILSEYVKNTVPKRHHFPMRNRIIAGLAEAVCVIEAKEKSGSLITAQLALENGREVFAVPGSILSDDSAGCHQLIQDGAKCTICREDILEELLDF